MLTSPGPNAAHGVTMARVNRYATRRTLQGKCDGEAGIRHDLSLNYHTQRAGPTGSRKCRRRKWGFLSRGWRRRERWLGVDASECRSDDGEKTGLLSGSVCAHPTTGKTHERKHGSNPHRIPHQTACRTPLQPYRYVRRIEVQYPPESKACLV